MKRIITLLFVVAVNSCLLFAGYKMHISVDGICYEVFHDSGMSPFALVKNCNNCSETESYSGTVTIPKTILHNNVIFHVTGIYHDAFANNPDLISVTLPDYYENGCKFDFFGEGAFFNCANLQLVNIPSGVTSVQEYAFFGCSSLSNINLHDNITGVGNYAFQGCNSITEPIYNIHVFAYMPTSYSGAYTIPQGIESIAGGAFSHCENMTSVTIPNSVKKIGGSAFNNCKGVRYIICEAKRPPLSVESQRIFPNMDCSKITLYVPDNQVETYKSTDQWKEFNVRPISEMNEAVDIISIEDTMPYKIMRDGYIIIQRGNKEYTITGNEL